MAIRQLPVEGCHPSGGRESLLAHQAHVDRWLHEQGYANLNTRTCLTGSTDEHDSHGASCPGPDSEYVRVARRVRGDV